MIKFKLLSESLPGVTRVPRRQIKIYILVLANSRDELLLANLLLEDALTLEATEGDHGWLLLAAVHQTQNGVVLAHAWNLRRFLGFSWLIFLP